MFAAGPRIFWGAGRSWLYLIYIYKGTTAEPFYSKNPPVSTEMVAVGAGAEGLLTVTFSCFNLLTITFPPLYF